jgi:hypothetical protein
VLVIIGSYIVFLLVLLLDGGVVVRVRITDDLTVLDEVAQAVALGG